MNTATSDRVIEMTVKLISRLPFSAASITGSPCSMWRTMFSSTTIASSTTKPTASVSAMSERLSRLYPSRYITANVPTSDIGSASAGIIVARTFRRNRKITITTRHRARKRVNFTSATDCFTVCERSYSVAISTDAGRSGRSRSTSALMRSATATVLVPGWRWMASTMARWPLNQLACLVSCTLSITRPRSASRTGAPSRNATTSAPKPAALVSWPSLSTE